MLIAAVAAACSLLTSAEIARVQGEAPKETKPSTQESPGLHGDQCFFLLPTFTSSISLELTRGAVRAFWKKTFHEQGGEPTRESEEKEEQKQKPRRVRGLGDEAFWAGDARLGGLYVLRKDAMLRLSIGGAETQPQKLKKLKTLARNALKRM
jgi:hypothetical protein